MKFTSDIVGCLNGIYRLFKSGYYELQRISSVIYKSSNQDLKIGLYQKFSDKYLLYFHTSSFDDTHFPGIIEKDEISIRDFSYVSGENDVLFFDFLLSFYFLERDLLIRFVLRDVDREDIEILRSVVYSFSEMFSSYEKISWMNEIIKVFEEISNINDINEVIQKLVEVNKKIFRTEGASILLLNEKTNELYFKAIDSEKKNIIRDIVIPPGKGIAGESLMKNKTIVVNDTSSDPRFYMEVDKTSGFKTKKLVATPIRVLGRVIGVLEAINKSDDSNFDEKDIETIEVVSNIAGINIQNSLFYEKLRKILIDVIKSLIIALEARDEYTRGHSERVQMYSQIIGEELGLHRDVLMNLQLSAILHDIGKIGIPDSILRKDSKLTEEEFEVIKQHPLIGYKILSSIEDIEEEILNGVLWHHERYDGKGYPNNLSGKKIPFFARIIAVADTFDAMTSDRPYRKGLPPDTAFEEIIRNKGSQFDPEVVEAFSNAFGKILEITAAKK